MAVGSERSRKDLVASLFTRIDECLRQLIARRCVLLQFPVSVNAGDSAIWLGQEAYLRKVGASVVYVSHVFNYSEKHLRSRLKDGIILLTGGGNLGDIWPDAERFRELIIKNFPRNKIVQLPQSIYFKDKENLSRAREVFDSHPDLTLFVRDRRSWKFALENFRSPSILCPDMAFALGALSPRSPPKHEILWLARQDIESCNAPVPRINSDTVVTDWTEKGAVLERLIMWSMRSFGRSSGRLHFPFRQTLYHWHTMMQLIRGCRILSGGRIVITDRLHGHILSLLMGIPNVLLDNNYGKVGDFYHTWTKSSASVHWANSPAEALETARQLAASEA